MTAAETDPQADVMLEPATKADKYTQEATKAGHVLDACVERAF